MKYTRGEVEDGRGSWSHSPRLTRKYSKLETRIIGVGPSITGIFYFGCGFGRLNRPVAATGFFGYLFEGYPVSKGDGRKLNRMYERGFVQDKPDIL